MWGSFLKKLLKRVSTHHQDKVGAVLNCGLFANYLVWLLLKAKRRGETRHDSFCANYKICHSIHRIFAVGGKVRGVGVGQRDQEGKDRDLQSP